jgi:hypothetical protein
MKACSFLLAGLLLVQCASALDTSDCSRANLPPTIERALKRDFPSWRIQNPTDLSPSATKRWTAEKAAACPGVAVGHFLDSMDSYAILLVPESHADVGYRLVVFSGGANAPSRELLVERWKGGGASNYFIRAVRIADFFSQGWRKRLGASVKDGILFADAGAAEYEVDIYYWSGGRFRHEPVDR